MAPSVSPLMTASPPRISFGVLLGLAWAVTTALLLAHRWPDMDQRLFDTDDAMRLVQVREFLGGHGWFDLHETRLNPPEGYDTHWSRLIDAGLAALFVTFRPFADPDLAERLMRAVWPLLWLLAAMTAAAALAWRIAGRNAALAALVISACAFPAFQHFMPGRIDHHNVQIALALAVVAAAAWSARARHAAIIAGVLTGLAAGIGLESLPFLVLSGAALALRFAWSSGAETSQWHAHALRDFGLAVAASTLMAFVLNVAPAQWSHPACDAMAINWLLAAVVAGLGLWLAARTLPHARPGMRTTAILIAGGAALFAFILVEPRCIHGPFALTDGVIKAIWLDHVDEMEPLTSFVRGFPLVAAWMCAFPFVAVVAVVVLACDRELRRDFGFLLASAAFLTAVAATFGANKIYSYALWFGIPMVAALTSRLIASSGRRANIARLAVALMLAPTTVTAAAFTAIQTLGAEGHTRPGSRERMACTRDEAYAALAGLPAGLVATEINYGPFVLALTPHSVIAAPYHRMTAGMVSAHTVVTASPDDARRIVDRYGVTYVAICGRHPFTGIDPPAGSLWAELHTGRPPSWLVPVSRGREGDFAVYRVQH